VGNQFEGMLSGGDTWLFAYIPSQYADEDIKKASRGSEMLMISKEERALIFLKIYFAYWDYCEG